MFYDVTNVIAYYVTHRYMIRGSGMSQLLVGYKVDDVMKTLGVVKLGGNTPADNREVKTEQLEVANVNGDEDFTVSLIKKN